MRYVRDTTGRFPERPHYEPIELDRSCEKILTDFFGGEIPIPITTDDLTRLIERDVSDFDPGADLSVYGSDVEGVTEFKAGRKPRVRITADLAYDEIRENRYRTTLTHEYGHVHFHTYLFEMAAQLGSLFERQTHTDTQVCKRDRLINAPALDWMEWQAGYVCGALLMPVTHLRRALASYQQRSKLFGPINIGGIHGVALVNLIRNEFKVSRDAARVRLSQQGVLQAEDRGPSLFARTQL
jgi:hypothetical protein